MSGTSADGIDAVLVEFRGPSSKPKWKILNFASISYPDSLREAVVQFGQGKLFSGSEFLEVLEAVTEFHAKAAQLCDPQSQSELVGCHGQTLWHRPPEKDRRGGSLQVLQAPLLAQLLNKTIIYDFRAADIALGGHGAPLVPKPDVALLGRVGGWRAVLNLGGIANLTLIPPQNGPDRLASIIGWDCGPANSLVDLAMEKITNGKLLCDLDGACAARGNPDLDVISDWLMEPFFNVIPPKSTGRDQFGIADLERRLETMKNMSDQNQIATLTSFTAAIVAQDLERLYQRSFIRPLELIVSGGGSRNPVMLEEIRRRCKGIAISTVDQYGISCKAREPLVFALLAWWNERKYPGNSPSITGANHSVVLGERAIPTSPF